MIVVGIGYASECKAAEIVTLIGQVCLMFGVERTGLEIIATLPERAMGPALVEAALDLGLTIVVPPEKDLKAAAPYCATQSERAQNRFGLPSVAEACALAAAAQGGGGLARLLGPRLQSARATCAIAVSGPHLKRQP
ncbi:MAG: cobalamin biosynthesis protein [Beijerinckiaceae bacterium]|nr:cobalamin biosynthesis protein [Beijerinckiaceae bacterium]